jgi:lysophospholipase L1-like esterase
VAAAYLGAEFGVNTTHLLESNTATLLDPGESVFLLKEDGGVITGALDESTRVFNRPFADSYLQFIASSDRFDTGMLQLEPLPEPQLIEQYRTGGERGLNIGKPKPTPMPKGWNTVVVKVRVPNPEYNKVDTKWLQRSIDPQTGSPYLAHFLFGLYFDKKPGLNGALTLKKGIGPAEKGLVWNAALAAGNFWAHWRRSRQYDKMVENNPKLPKFLAEGDSWFQHPLLTDIIDNIGRHYPVYCLSAAGDTMENYFKDGELFKKLPEVKPALILLSGGGNDILGEDMPKFFQDHFYDAPEGERADRFFRDTFFKTLDKLQNIYRQIFERLSKERPGIPILVHSYDYPRPLKPGVKKSSWIGARFDEKHIAREGDRTAAVHMMIDEFNKRLKSVTGEFKNVHYIDLRGRVADNQWDDEIHPNDVGYERVAAMFLRKIVEIFPMKG